MSEDSPSQVSTRTGRWWRWKVRSISTKTRRVVFLSFALLVIICLSAVGSMRTLSTEIDHLILRDGPIVKINEEIYRDMTEAQGALLRFQLSGDSRILHSFREARVRIFAGLTSLHSKIELHSVEDNKSFKSSDTDLEAIQKDAIDVWLANALKSERAVLNAESPNFTQSANFFEEFQRANSELNDHLQSESDLAESRARTAYGRGTVLVIAVGLVASVVMLIFGLRLARIVSKPLVDLRDTMRSQREGDLNARARENWVSVETRDLAHGFNLLADHESELQRVQSRAMSVHDLTVRIQHAIRIAPNTQQALEILCVGLGTGLGVDRVLTNTVDADLVPMLSAQWHRPDLSPLGDLPDELIPHISEVAEELWGSSGHLVSDDRLALEAQNERSKAFYRYTGARAAIVAPIGVGDQVIGMIYVVTTLEPRQWADSETNAVERVGAFLAQFIVEQTYRDQLNEHIERLEQLNRQKDNFVDTVSHELRTPLTSIIGYLEMLKDGFAGELIGEQPRLIEVIDRNASRLLGLINDLLTLTQGENGGLTDDVVDVSISELITESCQELPSVVRSDSVTLEIDAGPKAAIVRGDREQLKSVIINLISNAIKFSRPGGVVTIRCTLDEETSRIRIIVEDRGIGIPAADQKELFTRFFRGSNATAKFIPGTGLGLSIVKQIVTNHGGEVQLSSIEDEGTTVVVELPRSTEKGA